MRAPTGEQFELTHGGWRAVVTEVAASLRELSADADDLVQSYPETSAPPYAAGIILVPWPNRVRDGKWTLDGRSQQLDLTEVGRHNASHGLLRYAAYRVTERSEHAVTLSALVPPQHGYPFLLDTSVRYQLADDGLSVTHTIVNESDAAAPVAIGAHPFLRIGDVPTAELTLTVHAATRFEIDEQKIPTAEVPVGEQDLRDGRRVGDLDIDLAFGQLSRLDGMAASLTAPDGRQVGLVVDDDFRYVQAFVTRDFPGSGGVAVALEPLTAPADAFNSGTGLRWLQPGERWSPSWGIRYIPAQGRLTRRRG